MEKPENLEQAKSDTELELERIAQEFSEIAFPSLEYMEGKIKIDHSLPLAEKGFIRAKENEGGLVQIIFEKADGSIINFRKFLPPDWQFVSPSWCLKTEDQQKGAGIWYTDERAKIISIGEIRNIESTLALLHELGHVQKPENMEKAGRVFKDYGRSRPFNYESSFTERSAWADTIKIMRGLKKEGLDLFEIFGWEKIKRFVFASLANHRYQARLGDLKSKEAAMEMMKNSTGSEPKFIDEDLLYLEKLFDKGRFVSIES